MAKSTVEREGGVTAAEELKALQKEVRTLLRPFFEFSESGSKDLDVDALDQILKRRPNAESLARELDHFVHRLSTVRGRLAAEGEKQFEILLADFVRGERTRGVPPRDPNTSTWRIGRLTSAIYEPQARGDRGILDLEHDAKRQAVRVHYDGEKLLDWERVSRAEDLEQVVDRAYKLLESYAIPRQDMILVFAAAYHVCEERGRRSGKVDPGLVPVKEFLQEIPVELTRHVIGMKGANAKLPFQQIPHWAFLYNLDRYQVIPSWPPGTPRLALEIGNQAAVRERRCVPICCLQSQGQRQCCYIKKVS